MKQLILLLMLPFAFATSAGEWTEKNIREVSPDMNTTGYFCSSELDATDTFGGAGPYSPQNLFDNDSATAWVEGVKGYGEGEYILFGTGPSLPEKLVVRNGYQKSESLFTRNSRIKTGSVSVYAGYFIEGQVSEISALYRMKQVGESRIFNFEDKMGTQEIELLPGIENLAGPRDELTGSFMNDFSDQIDPAREMCPDCSHIVKFSYFVRLEITDVYKGSSWDDTCISDILFSGCKYDRVSKDEKITAVYESDEGGQVLVDTETRVGLVLEDAGTLSKKMNNDDDTELWITLMDVSGDKNWAQIDYLFSSEGQRVEEYSVLYYVPSLGRVPEAIMKPVYGGFGFLEKDGIFYFDTADGEVDLGLIKERINNK